MLARLNKHDNLPHTFFWPQYGLKAANDIGNEAFLAKFCGQKCKSTKEIFLKSHFKPKLRMDIFSTV